MEGKGEKYQKGKKKKKRGEKRFGKNSEVVEREWKGCEKEIEGRKRRMERTK